MSRPAGAGAHRRGSRDAAMETRRLLGVAFSAPSLLWNRSSEVPSHYLFHFILLQITIDLMELCSLQVKTMVLPQDFLLISGEKYITVEDYATKIPDGPMDGSIPPGQSPGTYARMWKPQVKRVVYLLIRMIYNIFDSGHYVKDALRLNQIVLVAPYAMPKLRWADFGERKQGSAEYEASNMRNLAALIKEVFLDRDQAIPQEIVGLLFLMQLDDPFEWKPLIQLNTCLISIENRGELLATEYSFLMDIEKRNDAEAFNRIISNLEYPAGWAQDIKNNTFLTDCFDRHLYELAGADGAHHPAVEALRYNRNVPVHALQRTMHRKCPHGMKIKTFQLNHALYLVFEKLLASLHEGLHLQGHLEYLKVDHLFWCTPDIEDVDYQSRVSASG